MCTMLGSFVNGGVLFGLAGAFFAIVFAAIIVFVIWYEWQDRQDGK